MGQTTVTWGQVYCKGEEIVSRNIAGDVLLVPVRGRLADMQRIFSLNTVGAFIWDRLDGAATAGDLRDAVAAHFEVSSEQAGNDIRDFIGDLLKEHLIREAR